MRKDILAREEEIVNWIKENKSKAWIAKQLRCNIKTFESFLQKKEISYSGNKGLKGSCKPSSKKMSLEEYLNSSKNIQSDKVRKKLLEEGYKEYRCECCGLAVWMGRPIPLELHHIDGNHYNNTLENFQLLCPNCHAQTSSYRGKNCAK